MNQYITKRETFERIRVVGPIEESKQVLAELQSEGWHVTHVGPYTDRNMHPMVDVTQFLFIAERDELTRNAKEIGQ